MDNWKNKFDNLVRKMEGVSSNMGIYPQAIKGMGEEKDYEQRDGYKNGWNAAVLNYGQSLSKAVFEAMDEQTNQDTEMLLASGLLEVYQDGYYINVGDTFAWACADAESVSKEQIPEVARLFKDYGWCGVLYWVAILQRKGETSEFYDINRFIEFVKFEEDFKKVIPESSKRAYIKDKDAIDIVTKFREGQLNVVSP